MNEQNDLSPKSDAAIQVRVCGNDLNGQRFDETTAAFPTSKGVMLETVHQLREGCTLEITHIITNRKATAQVKSMGPQLGASRLVFLEGTDVGNLWIKGPAKESEKSRGDGAPPVSETVVPSPERALTLAKLRMPSMNRFLDTFSELVESALDENLRPTVEQLTSEIQQKMLKTQDEVRTVFEEKMQAASAEFIVRWNGKACEVATRNEEALAKRIAELMESARGRLVQDAENTVADAGAKSQTRITEELNRLDKQVKDWLHAAIMEGQNSLLDRACQAEEDLTQRLSAKINESLNQFSTELEKRLQQALVMQTSLIDKHMEQAENAMADRVLQMAQRLTEDIADQNRTRIARSLRELAGAMEKEELPALQTADAAD